VAWSNGRRFARKPGGRLLRVACRGREQRRRQRRCGWHHGQQSRPDSRLTARLTATNEWGHSPLALGREIQANVASGPFTGRHGSDFGYGLSAQGVVNTHFGKDKIYYQSTAAPASGATFCAIR